MNIHIFESEVWRPFAWFGFTSSFWELYSVTLLTTWLAMFLLFLFILAVRWYLQYGVGRLTFIARKLIEAFVGLIEESFGTFKYRYFSFIASLFLFTLFCNLVGLLPFIIEPTHNLNTTLALGVTSFLYSQIQGIKVHGFVGHFKEYFQPFFLLFPLNIVGESVKAVSMSFRLFGNILGGSIILTMVIEAIGNFKEFFVLYTIVVLGMSYFVSKFGLLRRFVLAEKLLKVATVLLLFLPYVQMFFGLFEGIVQAFVITILSLTYLSMATQVTHEEEVH
jgi:F-type H+-transporting ATPase subunit a